MQKSEDEWVVVDETSGPGLAEILRGLLEACGIEARTTREGASEALPFTVGILGTAQILVRAKDEANAREVIEEYYDNEIEPGEEEPPEETA
jgi:hypothetical protein